MSHMTEFAIQLSSVSQFCRMALIGHCRISRLERDFKISLQISGFTPDFSSDLRIDLQGIVYEISRDPSSARDHPGSYLSRPWLIKWEKTHTHTHKLITINLIYLCEG